MKMETILYEPFDVQSNEDIAWKFYGKSYMKMNFLLYEPFHVLSIGYIHWATAYIILDTTYFWTQRNPGKDLIPDMLRFSQIRPLSVKTCIWHL